jgi:GAF domain-containing protein
VASGDTEEGGASPGVGGLLTSLCRELTAEPGGAGSVASRVIGDVLIEIAEYTPDNRRLQLGHGYLVSEFPETAAVIETLSPRVASLADADVDPGEAKILRELGFDSLLMLPLVAKDGVWALVELYRADGRPFSDDDVVAAVTTVARFARLLEELLG